MTDKIKSLPYSQSREAIQKLSLKAEQANCDMLRKIVNVAVGELEKKGSEWYE